MPVSAPAPAPGILARLSDHPAAWAVTAVAALVLMLWGFTRAATLGGFDAFTWALWALALGMGVLVVPLWGVSLSGDGSGDDAAPAPPAPRP